MVNINPQKTKEAHGVPGRATARAGLTSRDYSMGFFCLWGLTMERGYVKLWRKSLDGKLLKNHKMWVFWSWCLMKASHKKHKQIVGYQTIELNPGQFIFGRKAASKELNISEQSIKTILYHFTIEKKLTLKPTNKFTIITVVNWPLYQGENTATNQQLTSNQPATNQQLTTNKNGKKGKNGKKEDKEKENTKEKTQNFKPPTSEQITDFLREQNLTINIDTFLDHYQSNGWMVGKNKMKDWKATVRNWARRDKEKKNKPELKARNFREEYNIQSAKAFLERGKDEF